MLFILLNHAVSTNHQDHEQPFQEAKISVTKLQEAPTDVTQHISSFLPRRDALSLARTSQAFTTRFQGEIMQPFTLNLDAPEDEMVEIIARIHPDVPALSLKNCTPENVQKFVKAILAAEGTARRPIITSIRIKDETITDAALAHLGQA